MIILAGTMDVCFSQSIQPCVADELVCPDHSQFNSVLNEGRRVLERSSTGSHLNFPRNLPAETGYLDDVTGPFRELQNNLPPSDTELAEVRVVTKLNAEKAIEIALRCAFNDRFDEAIVILNQVAVLSREHTERSAWLWETLGALHALKGMPCPEKQLLSRRFADTSRDRLLMLSSLSSGNLYEDLYKLVSQSELKTAKALFMQAVEVRRAKQDGYHLSFDLVNLMALRSLLKDAPSRQDEDEILRIEGDVIPPVMTSLRTVFRDKSSKRLWIMVLPQPRMTSFTADFILSLARKNRLAGVEFLVKDRYSLLAGRGINATAKSKELVSIEVARRRLKSNQANTSIPIYADIVAGIDAKSNGTDTEALRNSLSAINSIISDITSKTRSSRGFYSLCSKASVVKTKLSHRIAKLDCLKLADELNRTGFNLERCTQYKAARKMYEASLEIKVKNLGLQDRCTAAQLVDLARVSAQEGKNAAEVKRFYEQALAIYRKKPERDDAEFKAALEGYALYLASKNETTKSELLYGEVRRLP